MRPLSSIAFPRQVGLACETPIVNFRQINDTVQC
jgi:hypothetical protein